jgi:cytochrome c-type biogenesis protein CcmH
VAIRSDPAVWRGTLSTLEVVIRRAAALILAALALASSAATAAPRASFNDVEDEVMCTVCGVPLNLAPQDAEFAIRQRAFIRRQVAAGRSKEQIKDALAEEYGREVLALPDDEGFSLAAYAVPIGVLGAALIALALAVPRWRRRGRSDRPAAEPALSTADRRRLDEDLARYDP